MRRIDLIICHCSATRVTRDFSPEDLEACHKARGYKTTGYHYYITKDGKLHKCRPEDIDPLKEQHPEVTTPYNLSAKHWIGIVPSAADSALLRRLTLQSYLLVKQQYSHHKYKKK